MSIKNRLGKGLTAFAALAALLCGCDDDKKKQHQPSTTEKVKEEMSSAGQAAKEELSKAGEATKEAAKEMGRGIAESSKIAGQAAKEKAKEAGEQGAEAAKAGMEATKEKMVAAKETIAETATAAKEKVTEMVTPKGQTLNIGVSLDYAPFESSQNGKPVGFDIDFAYALAKVMGMEATFKDMPMRSLVASGTAGGLDLIISGFSASPARAEQFDFSVPYYSPKLAILSVAASPVAALADNIKVGVQTGSSMEQWLKTQANSYNGLQLVSLDSNNQLVEELKGGHVHAVLLEDAVAANFVEANKGLTHSVLAVKDGAPAPLVVALPKGSNLLAKVNDAIEQLVKDGTMDKLKSKWKLS